jgi:hypothetical protein
MSDIREVSGEVRSTSRLVSFLYSLMRDHLPCGVVEELVKGATPDKETLYSNGWLASYAEHLANRISPEKVDLENLKADLARISAELGLPPGIGPADGEIRKLRLVFERIGIGAFNPRGLTHEALREKGNDALKRAEKAENELALLKLYYETLRQSAEETASQRDRSQIDLHRIGDLLGVRPEEAKDAVTTLVNRDRRDAEAVKVLKDMLATWEVSGSIRGDTYEAARRILASAGLSVEG